VPKSSKPSEAKSQHERFVETAREFECDEDKEQFEEKLKRIARARKDQKFDKGSTKRKKP
jgi:hypothetical protein